MPTPPNRALAAPHASSSPDVDGRRCFQGCSGIPALLPELWLLAVSGLTLTSSGVGNSGIFPPNSRVFPPLGRNLHDCYQRQSGDASCQATHFIVFHLHICTQTQMCHFLSCAGVGDLGLIKIPLLGWTQDPWGSVLSHSALQNSDKTFHLWKVEGSDFPQSMRKWFYRVCMWQASVTPPLE